MSKATLSVNIPSVTKIYGDLTISSDIDKVGVTGLQDLVSGKDYVFNVYDSDRNVVRLGYNSPVGVYTMRVILPDENNSLSKNYDILTPAIATYTIEQKNIPDFVLSTDGVLRENGTILNDKISVEFDSEFFVDGVVPEYETRFEKDGKDVGSVITSGTYYVRIVFKNGNYKCDMVRQFEVYEPQSYLSLIILISCIGGIAILTLIIVLSIRSSRRRYRRNIQKQQFEKIKESIKKDEQNVAGQEINSNQNYDQNGNYNQNNQGYDPNNYGGYDQNYYNNPNNNAYYDPNLNNSNENGSKKKKRK